MRLKLTKNIIFAVAIAFVTLSLFITFTQDEFITDVSINLLLYKTSPFPVIYFITGAFLIGLFIGLFVAVLDHFSLSREISNLKKESLTSNSEADASVDTLDNMDNDIVEDIFDDKTTENRKELEQVSADKVSSDE